jgi:hypothetical protein
MSTGRALAVVSLPSRTNVIVTARPSLPRIRCAICVASTGCPLISTIRSPGWRNCAAGLPASTFETVEVTSTGTPSMKTTASRTMAKTRFVPGPAKMTATRFQTAARQ